MSPRFFGWPSDFPRRIRRLHSKAEKFRDKATKLNHRLAIVTEPAERKRLDKAAKAAAAQADALELQFNNEAQRHANSKKLNERKARKARARADKRAAKIDAVRRKRQAKLDKKRQGA